MGDSQQAMANVLRFSRFFAKKLKKRPMKPPSTTEKMTSRSRVAPFWLAFALVPLSLIVALILLELTGTQTADDNLAHDAPREVIYPAPDFAVVTEEGETLTLADFNGQVLFLNFWQTWCTPCLIEMPHFREFLDQHPNDPIAVLAVNIAETPAAVADFFERNGIARIPVAYDRDSSVQRRYAVYNLPTTFVIDQQGNVRYWKMGGMNIQEMEDIAEQLLQP